MGARNSLGALQIAISTTQPHDLRGAVVLWRPEAGLRIAALL